MLGEIRVHTVDRMLPDPGNQGSRRYAGSADGEASIRVAEVKVSTANTPNRQTRQAETVRPRLLSSLAPIVTASRTHAGKAARSCTQTLGRDRKCRELKYP